MSAPIKQIRFGKISAALWENKVNDKSIYSWNFQKSFKKDQDKTMLLGSL